MTDRAAASARRVILDKVGILIGVLTIVAVFGLPFAVLRPNRIAAGTGLSVFAALPALQGAALAALWTAGALWAMTASRPAWRLAAGSAGLATLAYAVGAAATHVVAPDDMLARVSPDAGVWLLLFAWAVLIADALARLAFGPWRRLVALVVAIAAISVPLASGWWDGLSVMREYEVRSDDFWREALRHVSLAGGSVAAALVAGLPLGIACARIAAVRTVAMPVLNVVQTIPSIAMYGLMMAPLGLLAAHVPLAAALGIRGIGVAPALLALFLYSLLPIASSVVVGLEQVPAHVTEAARAMGMTRVQRLLRVDLVLALPVILSGVRIVLVQNIGLTAVAALIGGGGFGTFIFQGIGQSAADLVLLGAIPTIALALAAAVVFEAATSLAKGRAG
ncbi:MAG: ABC transporter permease [Burkholderia sp.]|jgi:osmoprotectant transport system permease protein|uniref:ABC transporter permease n=1 Tax=Burkholderia sp. TaxID=36773 RepID=UPI0025870507|nr:ABC transporter permease [Burkholderia sp.]MCA3776619.1 ABC transporter permease [Burkholderia sp.]MCA3789569.1 ABC transporter permease [Burkholderia sp.]MCA3797991.1 ABC transporter permease [Burkholderia sp.]MCA3801918.1 ABC transporter permease [Burkholderia sp.]MCA3818359.1 ABC transporter permease [Burkholderia sp.]